ncbi:MAG: hypothetical protein HRU15_06360 [Planctomycetes bacterium]|nr:hypothetical protein [Planctomycetota bacterium]
MAYTIQAIIFKSSFDIRIPEVQTVKLDQGFSMIPIVSKVLEEYGIDSLPFTDEGHEHPSENLRALLEKLSTGVELAYVEAEYFGGQGIQASLVMSNGCVKVELECSGDAINNALSAIGVEPNGDEFDALNLGTHRSTEKWVES